MKNYIYILVGIVALFTIFIVINQNQYTEEHPTLNKEAKLPDQFLKNVAQYAEEDKLQQSALNLEKAIASIWKLEQDVDLESFQKLENSIGDLEHIHHAMLEDTVEYVKMTQTFENVLDNLARAELEISEMYAETNQMKNAQIALKYAMLHIKNAMLFHDEFWDTDSVQFAIEQQVLDEMEQLSKNESVTPVEFVMTLDKMIKEMDKILITN